jgi:hypothetical protein
MEAPMWTHRILGLALAAFGLAVLGGQILALYGSAGAREVMASIGLAGSAVLTSIGAVSFSTGCLLAGAPHATVRHAARMAKGLRRR